MKKSLKKLELNKSTLSNLEQNSVNGGIRILSIGCSREAACPRRSVKGECDCDDTKSAFICKTTG